MITNILLSSYPGLCLPQTLCLPVSTDLSIHQLQQLVLDLLPQEPARNAIITTTSGTDIQRLPQDAGIQCLCGGQSTMLLPLRLTTLVRGGKGGFGSQLRAAGGRMSSRKRQQNAERATGSARNLDGRRLRTITEAKNLAAYLATKPDMDRKEKEERRKRWEAVVQLAEQREADMRDGKTADGRRKGLSSEWMEEKEEIGENVKNAVKQATSVFHKEEKLPKDSDSEDSAEDSPVDESDLEDSVELDASEMARLRVEAENGDADALWVLKEQLKIPVDLLPKPKAKPKRFAGFDDDWSDDSLNEEGRERSEKSK